VTRAGKGSPRLQLPYAPPEEYDLLLEFTPTKGNERRGLPAERPRTKLLFLHRPQNRGGQHLVRRLRLSRRQTGRRITGEYQARRQAVSEKRSAVSVTIEVRRDAMRALFDDKLLASWAGDWKLLSMVDSRERLPDATRLGLINYARGATYHSVRVREVTGRGTLHAACNERSRLGRLSRRPARSRIQRQARPRQTRLGCCRPTDDFEDVRPEHALMMQPSPNSTAVAAYDLEGKYATFAATILASNKEDASFAPLTFRVLGDDRELWKSQPLAPNSAEVAMSVSVAGVRRLQLEVVCPGTVLLLVPSGSTRG